MTRPRLVWHVALVTIKTMTAATFASGVPVSVDAQPAAARLATAPARRWVAPWAAVLQMADRRALDTAVVRLALAADAPPALATVTLHALGQIRDSASERLLLQALSDPRPSRAVAAAFGLGTLGRSGLADTTWARLEDVALGTGPAAAMAVRALLPQPVRAVRVARRLVEDSLAPRAARLEALVVAGLVREVVPVPATLILSPDTALARAATYAGARLRRPGVVRALLARATRPSPPSILGLVARGLGRQASGDSLADTAQATLRRLARHADPQVRTEAVLALGSFGAPMSDALQTALQDTHPLVRQVAASGLLGARRGDTAAVGLAWRADTGLHHREAVLQAMAGWTTDATPADARAWVAAPDWRRRAMFAQLVLPVRTRFAGGDASAFDSLLSDAEPRVRRSALEGMLAAGAPPFPPRGAPERLRRATDDPSPLVRAAAWGALARGVPDTADVPRAIAAWAVAVRDTVDEDARTGIARFLAVAYARATAPLAGDTVPRHEWRDEWTTAIRALPAPDDAAEAARLLPLFGRVAPAWPSARTAAGVALERPLAWYDSIVRRLVWPALAGRVPTVVLTTSRGALVLALDAAQAPLTVENLQRLAARGYFDGVSFHRVVPGFVVQGGDPTGTGSGGPGYAIRDELSPTPYERGTLGMALAGPDTGGSQWFLTLAWQPHLSGGYTVFGRVVRGWSVLDALRQHDRMLRVRVMP